MGVAYCLASSPAEMLNCNCNSHLQYPSDARYKANTFHTQSERVLHSHVRVSTIVVKCIGVEDAHTRVCLPHTKSELRIVA